MDDGPAILRSLHVRRAFDRAAARFEQADFVYRKSFDGLMERLLPLRIEPAVILDLGAATGRGSRELGKRYRRARVIAADFSMAMLGQARRNRPLFSRISAVGADATRLPLRTGSVDLVVANMLLPFIDDPDRCFLEVGRVLKKGGVFAFASLGPDSFAGLRAARDEAGGGQSTAGFADMHDIGDGLVRAGLAEPVLDVDRLQISYRNRDSLLADLAASGARNFLSDRRPTLTGRQRFDRMMAAFDERSGDAAYRVDLELVYGHAWGAGPKSPAGEFRIGADAIGRIDRR